MNDAMSCKRGFNDHGGMESRPVSQSCKFSNDIFLRSRCIQIVKIIIASSKRNYIFPKTS